MHTKEIQANGASEFGFSLVGLLSNSEQWGGSRWMGDPGQAPKLTGAAAPKAAVRIGRRYVSHEG